MEICLSGRNDNEKIPADRIVGAVIDRLQRAKEF